MSLPTLSDIEPMRSARAMAPRRDTCQSSTASGAGACLGTRAVQCTLEEDIFGQDDGQRLVHFICTQHGSVRRQTAPSSSLVAATTAKCKLVRFVMVCLPSDCLF